MIQNVKNISQFEDDEELRAFMEMHDGFELVDQGLAEIVETPDFSQRGKSYIEVDHETVKLLDELVTAGICDSPNDAVNKAIHSYIVAVLPHTYRLVREK